MCPDLPNELNRIKEEEEDIEYQPPYEAEQGAMKPEQPQVVQGQDFDYTASQEDRHPNLPDFVESENPTGGVDSRRQAGEQGDDDLKNFRPDK